SRRAATGAAGDQGRDRRRTAPRPEAAQTRRRDVRCAGRLLRRGSALPHALRRPPGPVDPRGRLRHGCRGHPHEPLSPRGRTNRLVNRIETDVCVIGAGLAGLTAARRLSQGGREVTVVEARDRVGGRIWTRPTAGLPIDVGATFIGPHHDRLHALTKEMGVSTFATHTAGDTILATGGKVRRYRGDVPRINPLALLSAGQAIYRLNAMAKKVPVDAPWDAPHARAWDARTAAGWLTRANVPTRAARDLIETTI